MIQCSLFSVKKPKVLDLYIDFVYLCLLYICKFIIFFKRIALRSLDIYDLIFIKIIDFLENVL